MPRCHRLFAVIVLTTLAWVTPLTHAASKAEIDAGVADVLKKLRADRPAADELASRAVAFLVFPSIIQGGIGVGGEVGEGALVVGGSTTQYYRVTSVSFGFQLGAQAKSEVIMFMTNEALRSFVESDGWEAGVDGSIAIVEFGVGKEIDTHTIREPIIGFIFDNKGLMYNLSLEGSKFWKIKKE